MNYQSLVANWTTGNETIIPNGVYKDFAVNLNVKGTAEAPIIFRAESPGGVVLTGQSTITIEGEFIYVDGFTFTEGWGRAIHFESLSKHCKLTRTAILYYNPPSHREDTRWVTIAGHNHVIDQNYFRGKNNLGMMLEVWREQDVDQNHIIARNFFGHFAQGDSNGFETVRIGLSGNSLTGRSGCVMEYNYFHRTDGENEIISNKSNNNIYRYNTFYDCTGSLTLRHGNENLVTGNIFVAGRDTRDPTGVRIIGERNEVVNNYFANSPTHSQPMQINNGVVDAPLNSFHAAKGSVVKNNTFYNAVREFVTIGQGYNGGKRPVRMSGVFNDNVLVAPDTDIAAPQNPADSVLHDSSYRGDVSTGQAKDFFIIEDPSHEMTFSGNVAFGRAIGFDASPQEITTLDPQMVKLDLPVRQAEGRRAYKSPFDIYAPSNPNVTAGFTSDVNEIKAPFTPMEIVPDWVYAKMCDGDSRFVFDPDIAI